MSGASCSGARLRAQLALGATLGLVACEPGTHGAGPTPRGGVTLRLEPDRCAEFCVDQLTAELYREGESVPLGPSQTAACGETLRFEDLPAGHRVFARLVAGTDLDARLVGTSAPATVAVDTSTPLQVSLEPLGEPLALQQVPARLLPGDTAVQLVGSGLAAGVLLSSVPAGASLVAVDDDRLTLTLPAAAESVTVSACGQAPTPLPLRRLQVGEVSPVTRAGCGGDVVALTAYGDGFGLALRCGNKGELHRLDACADVTALIAPLPAPPTALSGTATALVVTTAAGPSRLADGALVALPWPAGSGAPVGVAAADAEALVLTHDAVFRVGASGAERVAQRDAEAAPMGVAFAGGRALVLMAKTHGPPELRLLAADGAVTVVLVDSCSGGAGSFGLNGTVDDGAVVTGCSGEVLSLDGDGALLSSLSSEASLAAGEAYGAMFMASKSGVAVGVGGRWEALPTQPARALAVSLAGEALFFGESLWRLSYYPSPEAEAPCPR